eukprot:COSAG04_NODE_4603_length_1994_cov_2.033245_2_plen_306_part_00
MPARPARDIKRTTCLGSPPYDCRPFPLRPGACPRGSSGTRSAPPTSTLDSALWRLCPPKGTGTDHLPLPHLAPRLLWWPGVCWLGPSGTQSAPPVSTLPVSRHDIQSFLRRLHVPRHDRQLLLLRPGVCRLGPSGTQSAPPTSVLDSAGLRRLRRGRHRPHAAPRLASRSPAVLAAARRVPTRPVRDTERTATSTPGTALRLLRRGGHRPRAASRPFSRLVGRCRCGGCVTDDTDRALLLVSPHDRQLFLLRPGVCRLGPSGTPSAPSTSILDSAGLRRLRRGGDRPSTRLNPSPSGKSSMPSSA